MSSIKQVKESQDGTVHEFVAGIITDISEMKNSAQGAPRKWNMQSFKLTEGTEYTFGNIWHCPDISQFEGQAVTFISSDKKKVKSKFNTQKTHINISSDVPPTPQHAERGPARGEMAGPISTSGPLPPGAKPVGAGMYAPTATQATMALPKGATVDGPIAGWGITGAIQIMQSSFQSGNLWRNILV